MHAHMPHTDYSSNGRYPLTSSINFMTRSLLLNAHAQSSHIYTHTRTHTTHTQHTNRYHS